MLAGRFAASYKFRPYFQKSIEHDRCTGRSRAACGNAPEKIAVLNNGNRGTNQTTRTHQAQRAEQPQECAIFKQHCKSGSTGIGQQHKLLNTHDMHRTNSERLSCFCLRFDCTAVYAVLQALRSALTQIDMHKSMGRF